MKHPRQPQGWNGDILRVDLSPSDVEKLELLLDRLDVLLKIEEAMESVAIETPFIMGQDVPHITKEARDLIYEIILPWNPNADENFSVIDFSPSDPLSLDQEK